MRRSGMTRRGFVAAGGAAAGATVLAPSIVRAAQKVTLGVVNTISDAPYFIADGRGYFKDAGLDVEIINFPSGAKMISSLATGELDVAYDLAERSSYAAMFEPGTFYMAGGHNIDFLCSTSHNRPMIDDPRFMRLCARLGLAAYWVEQNRWPDCADQVPYDFKSEARRLAGDHA